MTVVEMYCNWCGDYRPGEVHKAGDNSLYLFCSSCKTACADVVLCEKCGELLFYASSISLLDFSGTIRCSRCGTVRDGISL